MDYFRDDLPQVVVGMAVTRTGIPVRVCCRPGNTADSALIRQVKTEMRDWNLAPPSRSPTAAPRRADGSCSGAGNLQVNKSTSAPTTGSSSAFTPKPPNATSRSARLLAIIDGSDNLTATKRAGLHEVISTRPRLHRFLRVIPTGRPRIDAARPMPSSALDGKYLRQCGGRTTAGFRPPSG